MALLSEANDRAERMLLHLEANLNRRLPFKGVMLRGMRKFLHDNLQAVSDAIDKAQADGNATKAIDMLVNIMRDSMPIPAFIRPLAAPFARLFFERVRTELHKNQDVFLDKIGSRPIPATLKGEL